MIPCGGDYVDAVVMSAWRRNCAASSGGVGQI
jgi:hypothetical protein